jgi:ABC transporter substrate binding protein (PQQ-dependent alcohol dehydrogenase system)
MKLRVALMILCSMAHMARADVAVGIGYLHIDQDKPPTLSNLDQVPEDLGLTGARTGIADNTTTGKFLGHTYELIDERVTQGEDPLPAAQALLSKTDFLILNAAPDVMLQIADLPEAQGALLFNASAGDAALRDEECRRNLLHTLPSVSMRTDALAQVLVQKRWSDLAMIVGGHASDVSYAEAMRNSLIKFGLKSGPEKEWLFDADMRRNAAQEVPLFTQELGDYDALIVADEAHDFGRYILYNTWAARPVVGSEGLTAETWHRVIEQWGAAQLQSRFSELSDRPMESEDYAAWAAIRTVGEAVTRTGSGNAKTLRDYILSDDFELAGFKGRPLTYRTWNGQLRQPIAVVHPRAMVAQAPLEGFLHRVNELDTLGLDQPESRCEVFR